MIPDINKATYALKNLLEKRVDDEVMTLKTLIKTIQTEFKTQIEKTEKEVELNFDDKIEVFN